MWNRTRVHHRATSTRRTRRRAARRLLAEPLERRNLLATLIELGNLAPGDGITLNNPVRQDLTGFSVATAGDVNGDGFDDVLIGAPVDETIAAGTGQAFLVFGKPGGFTDIDLLGLNGAEGVRLFGINSEDHAGFSVAGAGDVNGDGLHDVVIGAPFADRTVEGGVIPGTGQSYVVFGGFESTPSLFDLDGTNGFLIQGTNPVDRSGWSVNSAGDVNGDGFDDVILGAPTDIRQLPGQPGTSFVIHGAASGIPATVNLFELDGNNGFSQTGFDAEDQVGFSVSGLGDVNGDGFGDYVIGAPFADRPVEGGQLVGSGEAYVVFGGFQTAPGLNQLDGTNGFLLRGLQAYDRAGFSVSRAGDINGDGIDDILVSAPADRDVPVSPGKSYVVFGKASGFDAAVNLWELDGNNGFRVQGIDGLDHAGFDVRGAGDVNGDGFDDLAIGAPFADHDSGTGQQIAVGESYVVFGHPEPFPSLLPLASLGDQEGLLIRGEAAYDHAGYSISTAGDVNGDGFDDLLIGAPSDFFYSDRSGRAYLLFGRDFTAQAPQVGDAGDNELNGDGGANVMIGGQGDDTLDGKGGEDRLRGGEGDDRLIVGDLSFARVDGGRGVDTLALGGANLVLALAAVGNARIRGIEQIDLTGDGDNRLVVGPPQEVLNLSDTSNRLVVDRDAGDTVELQAGWTADGTASIHDRQYRIFRQGAAEVLIANLRPVLDLNGLDELGIDTTASYREDDPPSRIVPQDVFLFDEDHLISATATITNPLDGNDESLSITTVAGIQASYDPVTAQLSVTGAGTPSTYADLLRTLTYHHASDRPDTTDRVIEVFVNDGLSVSPIARATVRITTVNDAPILDSAPSPALSTIDEDTADPAGDTVASIIVDQSIQDPDGSPVEAMAVTGVDGSGGTWQFRVGGGAWTDFASPADTAARLLGPQDHIRFVPDGDFHGSATLTFRAWDQTTGSAGDQVDASSHGGTTAFSSTTDTARVTVRPVNDAPLLSDALVPRLTSIARDMFDAPGDTVGFVVIDGTLVDVDGAIEEAIAVTNTDGTNGEWQFSLDNGQTWETMDVTPSNSLLLASAHRVRFVPSPGFIGTATMTFRGWDRSAGAAGEKVDTTQNGGTTPFSITTVSAEIEVRDQDNPPTLHPIPPRFRILAAGTTEQQVNLTGISDGGGNSEPLTVTATSSDESILPNPEVSYTSPSQQGSLTLKPVPGESGWAIVTVTVSEPDGDSISRPFAVSVGDNHAVWRNPFNHRDVLADDNVFPSDVLAIINEINAPRFSDDEGNLPQPPPETAPPPFFDVSGNGLITPQDVLLIINFLNEQSQNGEGEGEDTAAAFFAMPAVSRPATAAPDSAVPPATLAHPPLMVSRDAPLGRVAETGTALGAHDRAMAAWDATAAEPLIDDLLDDWLPAD